MQHDFYVYFCLLYTSDAADERSSVDLGGRRIIKKKNHENQNCSTNTNNKKQYNVIIKERTENTKQNKATI